MSARESPPPRTKGRSRGSAGGGKERVRLAAKRPFAFSRMFSRLGGLLKCYRRVAPGTPVGTSVDALPSTVRASA